tara:strand:+ start:475 stop:744 length:270 start_codon:yes stop_codon:yes gene_type:complete
VKGWEHEEDKDKHEDELDRKNALKLPFVNSSMCPNCSDEDEEYEMMKFGMSDTNPYVIMYMCGCCSFQALASHQPHTDGLPHWWWEVTA